MQTQCSHCHAAYKVSDALLGKRAKCSKCQQSFHIEPHVPPAPERARPIATAPTGSSIPVAAAVEDPGQWSVEQRRSQVMSGFRRPFDRPRTSSSYRLGVTAAMMVMLLLPLLYGCFILGIGWAIWYHLANNWVMLQSGRGRGAILVLLLYLAPAVAGVVAIVFMFKPLLARPAKEGRVRSLTSQGEPVLFEFVERICKEVGAPMPKRIDIDNNVNASASFRSGWWSILRGNDLVLTIGMPLVSSLSLQQLAGVIAHEFGHFSQGAGMRVSYVLRSISHWFVRAVYERDSWDEWLENASREADLRYGWILYVARGAVWVSRRFLWCLMFLGYLLTGIIQKQMEYDADRYEVGMAGKKAFASTFRAIRTAAIGYEQAMETLGRTTNEGRLASDIPRLAYLHAQKIPQDQLNQHLDDSMMVKAHYFDSHPSDNDRIAAAEHAPDEGAFESPWPASALMRHFEAACIGVTNDTYAGAYGKNLSSLKIVPTSEVMEEQTRESTAWESLDRFFMNAILPTREFPLPNYRVFAPADSQHAAKLLVTSRKTMENSIEHYRSSMIIQENSADRKLAQENIIRLKRIMSNLDRSSLDKHPDQQPSISSPDPEIANKFVRACTIRLHTGCCLLHDPSLASRIPNAAQMSQQIGTILHAMESLDAVLPKIKNFEKRFSYLIYCFEHFERMRGDQSMLVREAMGVSKELVQEYYPIRNALLDVPYPFEHADASITIGRHLTTDGLIADEVGTVANACSSLISEYYILRGRCLGQLVVAAEAVETALGMPPLEPPKSQSPSSASTP